MFSKFDSQIHADEFTDYEPTAADWAEYHEWLHHEEEEFQLSTPEGWDEDDDSIGELSTDESIEIVDRCLDYSDCDDEYYEDYDTMGDLYDHD